MALESTDRPLRARAAELPPWVWAVAVSVGLHGLIVGVVVALPRETPPASMNPAPRSPAVVMRVGLRGAQGARAATSEAPAAGGLVRARTQLVAKVPSAALARAGEAVVVGAPVGAEDASEAPPPSVVGEPRGAGVTAAGDREGREGGAQPVEGGREGGGAGAALDVDVVGLVHERLAAGAERCYPAAARRYQQRGTAEVRFCVDASGQAQEGAVAKSSGSTLLDAAVGDCVLPAASPFPASSQGRCFTVPVRFGAQ
jgi:TonB family protein